MGHLEIAINKAFTFLDGAKRSRAILLADNGGHPDGALLVGVGYLTGKKWAHYTGGNTYKLTQAGRAELLRRTFHGEIDSSKLRA